MKLYPPGLVVVPANIAFATEPAKLPASDSGRALTDTELRLLPGENAPPITLPTGIASAPDAKPPAGMSRLNPPAKQSTPPRPPTLTRETRRAPSAPQIVPAPASPLLAAPAGKENLGSLAAINDKNAPPVPGIYFASPYTGIVVVPGETNTPFVKPLGRATIEIPAHQPDLRLNPAGIK